MSGRDAELVAIRPLPWGPAGVPSSPVVVAQMLATLQVEPGMRVLEIGTGTGYKVVSVRTVS